MNDLQHLRLAHLTFHLRARASGRLPAFLGSTLRGALASSLKEMVCAMDCTEPRDCLVGDRCPYAYLFETPALPGARSLRKLSAVPHPMLMKAPLAQGPREVHRGDELSFGLLMVGRAMEHVPYLVAAGEPMARKGLGAERISFRLEEVRESLPEGSCLIWSEGDRSVVPVRGHGLADLPSLEPCDRVTLRFVTPLRILQNKRLLRDLPFRPFARALLGRLSSLLEFHCGHPLRVGFADILSRAEESQVTHSDLQLHQMNRWSNRQECHTPLDGLLGSVTWEGGAIKELWPALRAGEVVHVGKGTTSGLGQFIIIEQVALPHPP